MQLFWKYFNILILLCVFTGNTHNIAHANEDVEHPKELKWQFDGMTGKFDYAAIQRGLQVYKEVCSTCHSLKRVAFRNLLSIGIPENEAKALAASYTYQDGPNGEGEMFERPGKLFDYFPSPYANDNAGRAANNGAAPPDLSLMIKAREDGANYVYSLLTGFRETPPSDFIPSEGMYYNPYYAAGGKQLAMAPPLVSEGQVTYADGTAPTIEQMAKDVVHFLQWAAEPEMQDRKSMGFSAFVFLFIFTGLFILAKKRIWRRVK
jgi:ubiquinol-cytochrome c reductase cytochrome c1 subunit